MVRSCDRIGDRMRREIRRSHRLFWRQRQDGDGRCAWSILGSGVVGVTSAWYLAQAGHEVTVLDRQPAARHGDQLRQCRAGLARLFVALGRPRHSGQGAEVADDAPPAAGRLAAARRRACMRWLARMLANCTEAAYAHQQGPHGAACRIFSRDCLRDLRADTGIAYDERTQGTLQLFRTQKQLDAVGDDIAVLEHSSVPYEVLDAAGCVAAEPALGAGRRASSSAACDCRATRPAMPSCSPTRLAALAAARGRDASATASPSQRLEAEGGRSPASTRTRAASPPTPMWWRSAATRRAAAAAGHAGAGLSGEGLFDHPADHRRRGRRPVSTVMDETYKVAITRLGDRIRVGGTAELAGFSTTRCARPRRETLDHSVSDLFPRGGDLARASFWTGLRPMTPDGTPVRRPDAAAEPVPQHRPRHAGLDHGLRLRPAVWRTWSPGAGRRSTPPTWR